MAPRPPGPGDCPELCRGWDRCDRSLLSMSRYRPCAEWPSWPRRHAIGRPSVAPSSTATQHRYARSLTIERARGPVWYATCRLPDGRQVQKHLDYDRSSGCAQSLGSSWAVGPAATSHRGRPVFWDGPVDETHASATRSSCPQGAITTEEPGFLTAGPFWTRTRPSHGAAECGHGATCNRWPGASGVGGDA